MNLYLKYFSIHMKSQMQYKVSFFLTLLGQFLVAFSGYLSVYFLFTKFSRVEGFSFSEVLLCFASVTMSFSLAECFVRGFDSFSHIIGSGEFDRIMVRPKNVIFQVLASKIDFSRLGKLIQAVIILAFAIPASGVEWTAGKILTVILMILAGCAVFSALFVIYASLCFFTVQGLEVINIFTDGSREFGKYPVSIYGRGILKFLTYVIPVALFQYYPFLYLTNRTDNVSYIFIPVLSTLFLIPGYIMWKTGLKHYKSTGS